MLHLASQLQSRDLRLPVVTAILLFSTLLALTWSAGEADAAQTVPQGDAGVTDPSRLAVLVVGAGLIGVLLFGVRLVASRRSRRP